MGALLLLLWAGFEPSTATAATAGNRAAPTFWSFQPVQAITPPLVRQTNWVANPVDQFILARLESAGLSPAPSAGRGEWIRRLSFDLTGLPPSPEQIAAFVNDRSPDAETRLVNRLLDSPHFGERQAQHWLDVVRYAETEGFEYDRHLPEAWRFRDYVIASFNADKPFNQFVAEQIAGDELAPGDPEHQAAAIFHRLGPVRRNAGNPDIALSRNEVLTERTDIVGAAFLGLTVGCARCHDHKLDPISQQDYYRLQAYFAATAEHDILLGPADARKRFETGTAAIKADLKKLRDRLETAEGDEERRLKAQIEAVEATLPAMPPTIPSIHNDAAQRTAIHVLKRGEWELKGERVGPRPPTVLVKADVPELAPDAAHPRTELARWLTDPGNPLTARVIVNRLWQQHFGIGLVRTSNDFGSHGERPSHPELLDWLAGRLVANGWRLKPVHRLILLSQTYRQSSRLPVTESAVELDPDNRLLSRFPRRRLSAEEIRDAMLSASGRLSPKVGGPSVMVPVDPELVSLLYKPAQWEVAREAGAHDRRSIYLIAKRNLRLPFMEVFDQPALLTSCGRRETSTHAPQALELLNGTLANELADAFARRLERESNGRSEPMVTRGYQLAAGRDPSPEELRLACEFLRDQPVREFALALFNLNAFLYVD